MPNSVRPARLADAPALAAIQRACWAGLLGPDAPSLVDSLDAESLAATWADAIALATGDGPYQVFCALDGADQVVGFAAAGPLTDPDGAEAAELIALWVTPAGQRAGHGSRLLAAVADAVRAAPSLPAPAVPSGEAPGRAADREAATSPDAPGQDPPGQSAPRPDTPSQSAPGPDAP
ncbi:MAG: GNAT family N-acetyltransferase, partial [Bifidobacteriaceae bacterium]|nr:GNAT family N-acetyltransferase [Bifidobacteriaceae bacterium]